MHTMHRTLASLLTLFASLPAVAHQGHDLSLAHGFLHLAPLLLYGAGVIALVAAAVRMRRRAATRKAALDA